MRSLVNLSHLARPGAEFAVRVTPKAAANGLEMRDGAIRIQITVAPEAGKANKAAAAILAAALGVAKTRLTLMRGAKSRDKLFRLEP